MRSGDGECSVVSALEPVGSPSKSALTVKIPSTASESAVRVILVRTMPVCMNERLADASPAVGLFMRSKANVGAEELTVKVCSQCLIAETLTTPVDAPVIEMPDAAMLDHAVRV